MWMTLPLSAQIPIRPRMTPVPMHRVRRILPEKRWKKLHDASETNLCPGGRADERAGR